MQFPPTLSTVWAPSLVFSTTQPTGLTYSAQTGKWIRLGCSIFITGRVVLTSKGTGGVGGVRVSGLPATVLSGFSTTSVVYFANVDLSAGYSQLVGQFAGGQTYMTLLQSGDNIAGFATTWTELTNTSEILFNGFYWTA